MYLRFSVIRITSSTIQAISSPLNICTQDTLTLLYTTRFEYHCQYRFPCQNTTIIYPSTSLLLPFISLLPSSLALTSSNRQPYQTYQTILHKPYFGNSPKHHQLQLLNCTPNRKLHTTTNLHPPFPLLALARPSRTVLNFSLFSHIPFEIINMFNQLLSGFGGFGQSNAGSGSPFGAALNTNNTSPFGGGNTGGSGLFGASNTLTFGNPSASTGAFGSAGATNTSPFGAANNNTASNTGFFGNSNAGTATSPFGGASTFGAGAATTNQGTAVKPFAPFVEKEANNTSTTFENICAMPEYKNFSFEELRCKDYEQGRRYGTGNTGGFGGLSGFGASTTSLGFGGSNAFGSSTGTLGFGQQSNTLNKPFGQTGSAFGGNTSTNAFGNTSNNAFGSSNSTFGQNNNQQSSGFGGSLGGFGASTNTNASSGGFGSAFGASKPAFGASSSGFGASNTSGFGSGNNALGGSSGVGNTANNAFGSTNSGSGGLFGQNNTASTGGGIFGNNNTSTFGANNNTQTNAFGASNTGSGGFGASAGGFGQNSLNAFGQNKPSGGLFGNNTNTNTLGGGLFGSTNTANNNLGGGLFGNNNNAANNTSGGLFGQNKPAASGGLFGSSNTASNLGGGLFGNNNNTNTNTGGGLFGNNNNSGTSGGLFGANNNNNTANTASGGLFGAKPAAPSGGGLFGSNNTTATTGGGLFGSNNTNTATNTGGGLFGAKPAALGGLFGGQQQQQQPAAANTAALNQQGQQALVNINLANPYGSNPLFVLLLDAAAARAGGPKASSTKKPVTLLGTRKVVPLFRATASVRVAPEPTAKPQAGALATDAAILSLDIFSHNRFRKLVVEKLKPAMAVAAEPAHPKPVLFATEATPALEASSATPSHTTTPKPVSPATSPAARETDDHGYWTLPLASQLAAMTPSELVAVRGFTVGRQGYGQVEFLRPVDLTAVAASVSDIAGKLVTIGTREAFVYPDDSQTPAVGDGLNVPMRITLENAYPIDADDGQAVVDPQLKVVPVHIEMLKQLLAEGQRFVSYDAATGTWVFETAHC